MSFAKRLLGYRSFDSAIQIRKRIERSKNYDAGNESVKKAKSLLIFQTTKQQTWLVSTSLRLYCVLDDIRKPEAKLQWSELKENLKLDGEYITSLNTRPKSDNVGLLDIGRNHPGWLFSVRLFFRTDIKESVASLLDE